MYAVIEYNTSTGHKQTIEQHPDTEPMAEYNASTARDKFASTDTATDHTYYVNHIIEGLVAA